MSWQSNLFKVHFRERKNLSNKLCNLEVSPGGTGTSRKTLFSFPGKAAMGTASEPLAAKLQGTDFYIHVTHLKKALNPDWTCTPSGDLKVEISQN